MNLELRPLRPTIARKWDELVEASDEGWVFGLSGWQWLIVSVQEWGLVDYSFAVAQSGRLVAVMPLQHQPAAARLGSSGWGGTGPILAPELSRRERNRVVERIFDRVWEIASSVQADRFDLSVSPVTRSSVGNRWGVTPYLDRGLKDVSTLTQICELAPSESELWNGLSESARRKCRKAVALGYMVTQEPWSDMVDEYYRVHTETYHRTGVRPHPVAYFEGIARETAPRGNSILWVGRDPAGRAVAFHNDARFGESSMYHTGCCETSHLDSGINYLLFWEAIVGARRAGCRWYEIGEVFPEAISGKNRGLTSFKTRFGGEPHRYFRLVREDLIKERVSDNGTERPPVAAKSAPAVSPSPEANVFSAPRFDSVAVAGRTWVSCTLDFVRTIRMVLVARVKKGYARLHP